MDKLLDSTLSALKNCLNVGKKDDVLIITDEPERKIGLAFFETAKGLCNEVVLVEIKPRSSNGAEPPKQIAEMMKKFSVVICPTSRSLTHTAARRNACKAGARAVTLPGILEDTAIRTLGSDYAKIAILTNKLAGLLSKASVATLTTPAGTNLTMSLKGREGHPDTGLVFKPGEFSNLPAGEAYTAPVEGATEGILVIDGAMAGLGILSAPLSLKIEKGYVTKISGIEQDTKRLEELIAPFGKPARNVAELGIGTNPGARLIGSVLEDEKVLGTVHVAIGDNKSMGGKVSVQSHLDGILRDPTLYLDKKLIMKNGSLVV
ncbi:MAG: aminopeptidase [Planctomycetes bacterium]|nr:aminopeptidase [Planctomycetota bacterium]